MDCGRCGIDGDITTMWRVVEHYRDGEDRHFEEGSEDEGHVVASTMVNTKVGWCGGWMDTEGGVDIQTEWWTSSE